MSDDKERANTRRDFRQSSPVAGDVTGAARHKSRPEFVIEYLLEMPDPVPQWWRIFYFEVFHSLWQRWNRYRSLESALQAIPAVSRRYPIVRVVHNGQVVQRGGYEDIDQTHIRALSDGRIIDLDIH